MTHKELEKFLLSFPNTWLDYPFGEGTSVYKVGDKESGEGKLFALIADGSDPLRVSSRKHCPATRANGRDSPNRRIILELFGRQLITKSG